MSKQKDFKDVISGILTGSGQCINGMYIEYRTGNAAEGAARTHEYFHNISNGGTAGYAVVPVSNAYRKDGKAYFQALVSYEDFKGDKPSATGKITAATLVHIPDGIQTRTQFVYTAVFSSPVQIVENSCTTIDICLNIGD